MKRSKVSKLVALCFVAVLCICLLLLFTIPRQFSKLLSPGLDDWELTGAFFEVSPPDNAPPFTVQIDDEKRLLEFAELIRSIDVTFFGFYGGITFSNKLYSVFPTIPQPEARLNIFHIESGRSYVYTEGKRYKMSEADAERIIEFLETCAAEGTPVAPNA